MKKIILLTTFLSYIFTANSQNIKSASELSTLAKVDFGFQGIGFTYEPKISKKMTTDLSLGIGGGYNVAEGYISYSYPGASIYLSATPKYFYNITKRIKQGKNVQFNSANYIGARFTLNMPMNQIQDKNRNSILTNIHWGIQRKIGNKFTLNTHVGIGYASDIDYGFGTIYPAIDFKVSYNLMGK